MVHEGGLYLLKFDGRFALLFGSLRGSSSLSLVQISDPGNLEYVIEIEVMLSLL